MKDKVQLFSFLLGIFCIFVIGSLPYFSGDVKNHIIWGESILKDGISGFYGRYFHDFSFPNYPPLSMVSFAFFVWLYKSVTFLVENLNTYYGGVPGFIVPFLRWENTYISFLKLPAIIPVIILGYVLSKLFPLLKPSITKKETYIYLLLFFFNPALFYLSAVWGQNDFMQNLFIITAFYFLLGTKDSFKSKRLWLALIIAPLAILSKQTSLIQWAIFLLTVFKLFGIRWALIGSVVSTVLMYIAYLPFNTSSNFLWPFLFYQETLKKSTGFLVTDNAINFWGFLFNYEAVDAANKVYLLSWEHWGFLMFLIYFLPLLVTYLIKPFSEYRLFNFLFLTSIGYFFFFTRMHERYLLPAVLFAFILFILKKVHFLNLIFFSSLLFINLYRGLLQPHITVLNFIVGNATILSGISILYAMVIAVNYYIFLKEEI